MISGFALRALDSGKVLDGTSMDGVDLGGQTRVEAANTIEGIPPRATELLGGGESFNVRAPQAGLTVDARESSDQAYDAGRSGIGSILKGPLFLVTDREVEPVFDPINQKRLKRTVNRIADEIDREPFVGALSVDPGTLEVTTEQPEAGVLVERGELKQDILDSLEADDGSVQIPVRELPAPTEAEVSSVAAEAEDYLRTSVLIYSAGGPARFTPEELAPVLAIQATAKGITLGVDRKALQALVADFAKTRDLPARDAGLDTPATPPVSLTEQGDLTWEPKPDSATVTPSRAGRRIRQERSVQNLARAVRTGQHEVRFPTEVVEPEITTRQMKGATSLLGTFTTNYSCCEPRVSNIQQMARTVDGTVVAPGEQFSLNTVAGERTSANGYKPAPTIGENNELIDTIGGGVSQFSTTLYNAAYFSGLQIDSHTPHSFYIDRYPAGRESTLNFGSIDLLWTNDTEAPVVIRSSAGDTSVTVSIYGDNDGRKVKADTQSRTANDQGGFDITVDRVIIEADGSRAREPFTTVYGVPAE